MASAYSASTSSDETRARPRITLAMVCARPSWSDLRILRFPTSSGSLCARLPPIPTWSATSMIRGRSSRSTWPPSVEAIRPRSSMTSISCPWAARLASFQALWKRPVPSASFPPSTASSRSPLEAGPESGLKFLGSALCSSFSTFTLAYSSSTAKLASADWMSLFSSSRPLVLTQSSVSSAWRSAHTAKMAKTTTTDAAATRILTRRWCGRPGGTSALTSGAYGPGVGAMRLAGMSTESGDTRERRGDGEPECRQQPGGATGLPGRLGDHRVDEHHQHGACGEPVDRGLQLAGSRIRHRVPDHARESADHRHGRPQPHDGPLVAARGAHITRRADRLRQVRHEDGHQQPDTDALARRQADPEDQLLGNAVQEGPEGECGTGIRGRGPPRP